MLNCWCITWPVGFKRLISAFCWLNYGMLIEPVASDSICCYLNFLLVFWLLSQWNSYVLFNSLKTVRATCWWENLVQILTWHYPPNTRSRNCDKRKTQIKQRYREKRVSSISIKPNTCSNTELYRGHGDNAHLLTPSRSLFRSYIQHHDGYACIAETCSCFDMYDESRV